MPVVLLTGHLQQQIKCGFIFVNPPPSVTGAAFPKGTPSDGKKSISMHQFFLDFSWHMKGIGKKNSGLSFHWPDLHIVQTFSVKKHWRHKELITTDPDPSRCYWGVTTSALTLKRKQHKCSPLVLVLESYRVSFLCFLCITVEALLYTLRKPLLWFSIRLIKWNWSQSFVEKYCIYQSQHKLYFFCCPLIIV